MVFAYFIIKKRIFCDQFLQLLNIEYLPATHQWFIYCCYPKVIQIMRKWITKWITILRLTILFFRYIFFYFCDYFRNAFFA